MRANPRRLCYGSIIRAMSSTTCNKDAKRIPPSLEKLKRMQMHFQREDGKPIWLKGGSDKLLYNTTLALCGIGLLSFVCVIYNNAKPPTWR